MFHVTAERTICIAHGGADDRALHGHNWRIRATLSAPALGPRGYVVEPKALEAELWTVVEPVDHRRLEDLPFLGEVPATAAGLAGWIAEALTARFASDRVHVARVDVSDGTATTSSWTPDPTR